MKKLYEITVSAVAYAVGETQAEAEQNFKDEVSLYDLNLTDQINSFEVFGIAYKSWKNAYPYGAGDDNRTCEEWSRDIEEQEKRLAEKAEWEAKQLKLF